MSRNVVNCWMLPTVLRVIWCTVWVKRHRRNDPLPLSRYPANIIHPNRAGYYETADCDDYQTVWQGNFHLRYLHDVGEHVSVQVSLENSSRMVRLVTKLRVRPVVCEESFWDNIAKLKDHSWTIARWAIWSAYYEVYIVGFMLWVNCMNSTNCSRSGVQILYCSGLQFWLVFYSIRVLQYSDDFSDI